MKSLVIPVRFSAIAFGFSGLTWAIATPLHPNILSDGIAASVQGSRSWTAIHLLVMVGSVGAIFGSAGIVAVHGPLMGRAGRLAQAAVTIGAVFTAAIMFVEAVAFPELAEHAPELLELDGAMLGSPLNRALIALSGLYPAGLMMLGFIAARTDLWPAAGKTLVAATVAFIVLGGWLVPVVGVLATAVFAATHVRWGRLMWTSASAGPQVIHVG